MIFKIISNPPYKQFLFTKICNKALEYSDKESVFLQPCTYFIDPIFTYFHKDFLSLENYIKVSSIDIIDNIFDMVTENNLAISTYNEENFKYWTLEEYKFKQDLTNKILNSLETFKSLKDLMRDSHSDIFLNLSSYNGGFKIITTNYDKACIDNKYSENFFVNFSSEEERHNFFLYLQEPIIIGIRRMFSNSRRTNYDFIPIVDGLKDIEKQLNLSEREITYLKGL